MPPSSSLSEVNEQPPRLTAHSAPASLCLESLPGQLDTSCYTQGEANGGEDQTVSSCDALVDLGPIWVGAVMDRLYQVPGLQRQTASAVPSPIVYWLWEPPHLQNGGNQTLPQMKEGTWKVWLWALASSKGSIKVAFFFP